VNLEMAVTPAMLRLACAARPHYCCLVPERRQELTTEGGLDVAGQLPRIRKACEQLAAAGIAVALFVDPDPRQLEACLKSGAPHVEIHTGAYAEVLKDTARARELRRIAAWAEAANRGGLEVHAGHGLNLHNVAAIAAIPEIVELNIGHSIVARALHVGFPQAVKEMRQAMAKARRT
jgi:pyridoxine 5-phosphate synthase